MIDRLPQAAQVDASLRILGRTGGNRDRPFAPASAQGRWTPGWRKGTLRPTGAAVSR